METDSTGEQMIASFSGPVEFNPVFVPRRGLTHVVFDFDGTLSWLRHGWPEMMYGVLRKHFKLAPNESDQALHGRLLEDILSLNGKPSIHQIKRGIERMKERGDAEPRPEELLREYQDDLDATIVQRTSQIASGQCDADDFLVFGVRNLLNELRHRGLTLAILSGTPEPKVKEEAQLLQISDYFGRHIYGSTDASFSKRGVLDRLLAEEEIPGESLLSFGDGPVEIQHTKELGGLAVGVASDENVNGSGKFDAEKRKVLLAAGADLLIPDYRDTAALLDSLFPKVK